MEDDVMVKDGHGNPLPPEQDFTSRTDARPSEERLADGTSDLITRTAQNHGVAVDVVEAALAALRRGRGTMAQFSHPAFGGMAQWSTGGMSMIGDMFNAATKAKFDGVLGDLADALRRGEAAMEAPHAANEAEARKDRESRKWPAEFGDAATAGSQNDMRYAFFPTARRLVIDDGTRRTVYDTGEHVISGVSQQQSFDRTLTFHSQLGAVNPGDLPVVP